LRLAQKKTKGEKITAVTAYDFPTARITDDAGIDIILVGDSLGMVLQGHENTLKVTMDEMIYHTVMVARAEPRALVVSDMPYQSFHVSIEKSVENACRFIKEGGAEAVKLEGGHKRFRVIDALLNAEIPVMGHLGLTPQSVNQLGGFKVQGKLREEARKIFADALELEKARGVRHCFGIDSPRTGQENQRKSEYSHHRYRRRPFLRRPSAGFSRSGGAHQYVPAQVRP
jgi:3-methyl-2-oxobutanoate hydroxymethyltransferase